MAAIAMAAASLQVYLDVPYRAEAGTAAHAKGKDLLDVYLPDTSSTDQPVPVLLWIHGGGLFMGDKTLVSNVGQYFARHGYAVVAVNHRLSPEVAHPMHVQDIAEAFAWSVRELKSFGVVPGKVFVGGHSAGGYLAALLCSDSRYLQEVGHALQDISGCISLSGFFHVPRLAPERPKHVWGEDEKIWQDASPAAHVDKQLPAMQLIVAEADTDARKAEAVDFSGLIKAQAGGPVPVQEVAKRDHRSIAELLGMPGDETAELILHFLRDQD